MREMNISSTYNAKSRITIVQIDVYKILPVVGVRSHCGTYIGRARWNKKYDEFNPAEGFKVAYERALATIPKENIIEKCDRLKDGDWVCVQLKDNNDKKWGIVFHDSILYVIGSDNFDRIYNFANGESEYAKITTIVRPIGSSPITYMDIYKGLYKRDYNKEKCEIYTAD